MKIAVCISGQPRNYEQGYYELKKWFLDKYDCDVYFHTWKDTQSSFTLSHNFTETHQYTFTEKDYDRILELYKPKDYIFQKPIPFDNGKIIGDLGIGMNTIMSIFYSIQQSFNLAKNSGIEYDLVIRYRFDLQFTDYVSPKCLFLKDLTQINPDKFNCFSYKHGDRGQVRPVEVDDLFNVGSMEVMEVHSQIFPNILYYTFINPEYVDWLVEGCGNPDPYAPETYIKFHLIKNNISIDYIDSLGEKFTAGIIR